MPKKLPVHDFKWGEDISAFDEIFIKSYDKQSYEWHFFEVDAPYSEKIHDVHNDLSYLSEKMKNVKFENLIANLNILFT